MNVPVATGQVLTVTASAGSFGTVWREGTSKSWTVSAVSPLQLGPGTYRIETITGTVDHSVSGSAAQPRPPMSSVVKKFKRLAERLTSVPASLSAQVDDAAARLDAVERDGEAAFNGLHAVLTDVEGGVAVAADVLKQITNGER